MSSVELSEKKSARMSEFAQGVRATMPAAVAAAPFGLLFGALAVQNGLTPGEAMLMSAAVFAGASQMVGLELFGQTVAPWLIVLSIFAVNFRHVLYSAAIGRLVKHWTLPQQAFGFFFLTDPQYAESERKGAEGRLGYGWYMGAATMLYIPWVVESGVGAFFGNLVPQPHALGLDFLLPIYFLGLVMDFRKRPLWLPVVSVSAVASIVAYYVVGSPWHVSIGAAAGVALAVIMAPARGKETGT